jgi:3-deoxy-alpha-D-manno-octulosonate 8-oxidase
MKILDTGIKNVRNVGGFTFGAGSLSSIKEFLDSKGISRDGGLVFLVDEFFENNPGNFLSKLSICPEDKLIFISTKDEPTTESVDNLVSHLKIEGYHPSAIIGMGGGITLDTAKAVSNLLTNGGFASDYQGWDLVKMPGVYKIGIPTISGTGAEATRTCVMTNKATGLKLGMNSDYTVFDYIIMDPDLTQSVPREQYFFTGMDAYIHCIEALSGGYRNSIGDAYSRETINLCRQVFLDQEMMSPINRERMMVASYLGGSAIATSYVGLVHPFSAGLSVVLGLHHCVANCIVMGAMESFYPSAYDEFWRMAEVQGIDVPSGICRGLKDFQYELLYASTIIHQKPLINALGEHYKKILNKDKVREIFEKM